MFSNINNKNKLFYLNKITLKYAKSKDIINQT